MYWVIHKDEAGEIMLWPCKTLTDIRNYTQLADLHSTDYAVIEGLKIKDIGNYVFNK